MTTDPTTTTPSTAAGARTSRPLTGSTTSSVVAVGRTRHSRDRRTEDGSMVSEYGLVAVLGATIAGLAISWARGGAVTELLADVMRHVRAVIA